MKQNYPTVSAGNDAPQTNATLEKLARSLVACTTQFNQDNGPEDIDQTVRIAFANGAYLYIKHPGDAATLISLLLDARILGHRDVVAVVAAFRGFKCEGEWIAATGDIVNGLWDAGVGGADTGELVHRVLFGIAAGLIVAHSLSDVAAQIEKCWAQLNPESSFLTSRLIWWRTKGWQLVHAPFVEFTQGFYAAGSAEQRVVAGSVAEVLPIAVALSNPWAIEVWAETGWHAGRKVGTDMPDVYRELIGDLPPDVLASYVALYGRSVLGTAANDGTVRPGRATLHYFGTTARDVYARTNCKGDQPRFIARAAYDFTFWMGLLSTQAIPVTG